MRARLEESERISTRQTLRILGRATRYVGPFRGRMAVKVVLTLVSIAPLVSAWVRRNYRILDTRGSRIVWVPKDAR